MAEEKFYSLEKDGTYCIGFPNRHALSEKEIEEIFSEYGSVISVRSSGDERGFRFVRYRTTVEAEKAVDCLKGHKKIRILPKKPKTQHVNDKGSSKEIQKNGKSSGYQKKSNQSNQSQDGNDDDFNNSFMTDDSPVTQSASRKKLVPYGGTYNTQARDSSDDTESKEKVNGKGEKENLMKLMRLRATRGVVANNFGSDSASIFDEENDPKFQDSKKEDSQSDQNKKTDAEDDIRMDDSFTFTNRQKPARYSGNPKAKIRSDVAEFLVKCTNGDDEQLLKRFKQRSMRLRASNFGSDVVSNSAEENDSRSRDSVTTELSIDDEPPELMSTEELKQRSIKGSVCGDEVMRSIPAEEVIVANIHEDISELYILYLLEKFEPISITEIKIIPEKGIRYCSVYFKSTEDAIAVERQFDNFELSGNNLIVRTPELLVTEVGAA